MAVSFAPILKERDLKLLEELKSLKQEAVAMYKINKKDFLKIVGNIEINDWMGKKEPNFIVKDIALANS